MASYPDGSLLQVTGNPAIYFLINGQLSLIPDPTTMQNLFGPTPPAPTQVSQSTLNSFPMGPPVTSGACIAGTGGTGSQQWFLTWEQKLWITAAALPPYQFYEPNLQITPSLVLNLIPQGMTLN
jgi:hypothetical protein